LAGKRGVRKRANPIQRFFRETTGELRKVSWPTREEAINLTRIVLIVIVVSSTVLGLLDVLFSRLFALILGA
jgi:preprotein translocase subunit SecE